MPWRFGPGPVFVYESIIAARRWQGYALRVLFVASLLVGLWTVWQGLESRSVALDTRTSLRELARLGERIYYTVAGTQLAMVLLAAPAATAGAVCIDRARGGLEHMFVTDLSDVEIVLGKLAARLLPVAALVASGLPVLALSTLLGGIIPEALVTLTLVTAAVAVIGCALALALSVRAAKTHEVLMAVFAFDAVWLLATPLWTGATSSGLIRPAPPWFHKLNPFVLAYNPYVWPSTVDATDVPVFLAVSLGISALAVAFAVFRLRAPVRPLRGDGNGGMPAAGRSTPGSFRGGRPPTLMAIPCSGASGTATALRAWRGP